MIEFGITTYCPACGLPMPEIGSGKTTLAKEKYVPQGYILVDDPRTTEDFDLHIGKDLVLTDPHLCATVSRKSAQGYFTNEGYEIEWVFFANNPELCEKNIIHRNDGRVIRPMKDWNYEIPEGIDELKVWNSEESK